MKGNIFAQDSLTLSFNLTQKTKSILTETSTYTNIWHHGPVRLAHTINHETITNPLIFFVQRKLVKVYFYET